MKSIERGKIEEGRGRVFSNCSLPSRRNEGRRTAAKKREGKEEKNSSYGGGDELSSALATGLQKIEPLLKRKRRGGTLPVPFRYEAGERNRHTIAQFSSINARLEVQK